jgi:membrane protease YdiL (CAAX protease family)
MRSFAWFLGLTALALAAIAVFAYPAWTLLHPFFDFPFHRVGERIGMLALLAGFLLVARRLRLADRASLGYGLPRRAFLRETSLGLALGVASMLAVVGLMTALGLLDWRPAAGLTGMDLLRLVALRAGSGFAVAFIEETFLRGAMHTAIERESGTRLAVLLTALFYAATHFFASYHIAPGQVTARSGLELLAGTLHSWAQPAGIADAFLALLAVGVVLGMVRAATGNIAACIGLHAGWVWVMLVAHELTRPRSDAPLGFLLSRFDGFVGWLVLAWTVVLAVPLWRFYSRRAGLAAHG